MSQSERGARMTTEPSDDLGRKIWVGIAVAGILFFLATMVNGWEVPWKTKVLFECPSGSDRYAFLDPHEFHPGCDYFGPPLDDR